MTDTLGPASINATTVRPADDRTFGPDDTWFKDCTSPALQDGTQIRASWLNGITAQLRRAIRGLGITDRTLVDPTFDDMLLDAIRAGSADAVTYTQAYLAVPIFPDILTVGKVLAFTTSTGQIIVNAAQEFVLRGVRKFSTDSYSLGARTFATVANKTYHLRFDRTNGFRLRDLADGAYNPGALAESNVAFDTTLDDMLVARVVTNGANALTVTALANAARLFASYSASISTTASNALTGTWSATLNWSRRPQVGVAMTTRTLAEGVYNDVDTSVDASLSTRYVASGNYLIDWPEAGTGAVASGVALA